MTPMRRFFAGSVDDDRALRAAYDEHARELLGFAYHQMHDRQLAEEAVQETFLKAWRNAGKFDPERGELRAWLFSILRNTIIDAQRRQSVRPVSAGDQFVELGENDDRIDEALVASQMQQAMQQLSDQHRHVLIATFYERRTVADVSRELNVPEGTVRSRQFYALKALRVAMEEMGWSDD